MTEISELSRNELEELTKQLQADCQHLNSIVAVYEMTLSAFKDHNRELIKENKELKTKLENYENN
jgi:hypothetical protein